MFPNLLNFGPYTLHAYGVFISLGVLAGLIAGMRQAKRSGLNQRLALDAALIVIICGVFGARALSVALEFDYFRANNPLGIFQFWQGGMVFQGGLIAGIIGAYITLPRLGLPFLKMVDAFAPALALGQAIGRVGCFFAGCCYGGPTNLAWAVNFQDINSLARTGANIHPTQLYHAAAELMVFFFLRAWIKEKRHQNGQVFAGYLIVSSLFRITIEFYRGDPRGQLFGLSSAQIGSGILIIIGTALIIWRNERATHLKKRSQ
jgi:phosphatidylglycerol:prolipoprotein diacylglycerol transferase